MSTQLHDVDPIETKEWLDALSSVLEYEGSERAHPHASRHHYSIFEHCFR